MKTILAIIVAALLFSSVAVMLPQVDAQSSAIGIVEQRMKLVPADGGPACYRTGVKALPAGLIGNICTDLPPTRIASFVFEIWVIFYSNEYTVTGTTLSNTVTVFTRDATYKNVPVSSSYAVSRVDSASNTVWQIYSSSVSASAVESVIGIGLADYTADIRITTTAGSVTVKNTNGLSSTKSIASQTTTFSFTQEGTSSGGSVGGTEEVAPTGRFYYVVIINGGGVIKTLTSTTIKEFSLAAAGDGTPFTDMRAEWRLHLDNPGFGVDSLKFDDPTAGALNYQVFVNDVPIDKEVGKFGRIGATNDYRLVSMEVEHDDIIAQLTELGRDADEIFKNGKIKFMVAHARMDILSPSKTYTLDIPAQALTYDLVGFELISEKGGDGEVVCEGTDCGVEPEAPSLLEDPMFIIGIAASVASVAGIVVVAARRKK